MIFNSAENTLNINIPINPDSGLIDISNFNNYSGIGHPIDFQYIFDFVNNPPIENSSEVLGFQSYNSSENTTSDGFGVETDKQNTNSDPILLDAFGIQVTVYQSNNGGYESGNYLANDLFSKHLLDQELIAKTRYLVADGLLSRNDMIDIFRDAQDGGVIDANEITDLRTILNNVSNSVIEDHVRVLSNKVVFGTTANAYYQGQALGNLYAGSSSDHMEKLINKWFFGSDRPSAPYTYKKVEGSLFKDGVSYTDISQGVVGNCYLLAALAKVAISSPSTIESMFIDNGDDTFTVRFFNNGVADYVTVDLFFPIDGWEEFIYANQAGAAWGKYDDPNNELWVALAEKAYAQLNEAGWIGQDGTNSYAGITGGWDTDAHKHITGTTANSSMVFNLNEMVDAYNNGKLMGVATKDSGLTDSRLVPNHIYVVVDYDITTQQFTLFNPWGTDGGWLGGQFKPGFLKVSITDLQLNFTQWSYLA